MATRANERDSLGNYRKADPLGREKIVFNNYHIFPKVIQSVICHSDIQTTMDIYAECT